MPIITLVDGDALISHASDALGRPVPESESAFVASLRLEDAEAWVVVGEYDDEMVSARDVWIPENENPAENHSFCEQMRSLLDGSVCFFVTRMGSGDELQRVRWKRFSPDNLPVRVRVEKEVFGEDAPIDTFYIVLESPRGSWTERFGSRELAEAFLMGVRARADFAGETGSIYSLPR